MGFGLVVFFALNVPLRTLRFRVGFRVVGSEPKDTLRTGSLGGVRESGVVC